ncbi:MAG: hypothetical protein GF353_19390 [Candidatus Lokiarchaeota archaeon]|nr:hypothetical protein [Candidatus Lokiarchaeota archaeon]
MKKVYIKKRKTELVAFLILAVIFFSSVVYFTYIDKSALIPSDFPVLNISVNGKLSDQSYVDGTLEIRSEKPKDMLEQSNCRIKIRGRLNARMPKPGYRIELNQRTSILGMREDDDWILFAMYMDLPRMRIKLSMDLWRTLYSTDPTAILPNSHYIMLYINGNFKGLYLLAEKNDRRLFGLDEPQNNENSSLIFQCDQHGRNFLEHDSDRWDQDWPNEDEGIYIKHKVFDSIVPLIRDSSDEQLFNESNGIFTVFHKENLIDFFIFNFFILHKDFWSQNYFLVRNTHPSKFFLIPWDFDSSFGQFLGREYEADENPEYDIKKRNYLFYRLLNNAEFMKEAKERWFDLRESLWSEENILDMLNEMYEDIKDVLEIDTDSTYPFYADYNWKIKIDEAVDYIYDWIPERLTYCDGYFTQF